MTSVQEFKCIFCKDTFESKEELQVHFRKHGDPNFGQSKIKTKHNEGPSSAEKKEEVEMVNCDVCSEVFPTISKAITHKHKVHPDHDAKYFCPWCGKLFTMKHLFNKHLQSTHAEETAKSAFTFPCNSCDVEFLQASAMLYHNKFFHRQDTELPHIGHSKKVKTFGQELLLLYYCPFCGDEFNNKMNLHKHMVEDHHDENQHPEDVLRCPLCEAIFYHLDAYELHLTFHSVADMYNEKNEIVTQITDFSLEAVPPLMEKVEIDAQEEVDPLSLAQMLQVGLDETADSGSEKKKRKKHKKSKKSAITLDEFLNMNQDVFGEGLDVQGIIEVPTQVVTNTLKRKQPVLNPGSKISSSELQKLKKQGIVVKMKKSTPAQQKFLKIRPQQAVNNPIKVLKTTKTGKNLNTVTNQSTAECSDVLSKLMNQSNSQIKIVKKSACDIQSSSTLNKEDTKKTSNENESGQGKVQDDTESLELQNETDGSDIKCSAVSDNGKINESQNLDAQCSIVDEPEKSENMPESKCSKNSSIDVLRKISQHLTVKPLNSSSPSSEPSKSTDSENETTNNNTSESINTDNESVQLENKDKSHFENQTNYEIKEDALTEENPQNMLKNLSKFVTVKPVSPKTTPNIASSDKIVDDPDDEISLSTLKDLEQSLSPDETGSIHNKFTESNDDHQNDSDEMESDKPLSALKNLSKFLTVKSLTPKISNELKNTTETEKENCSSAKVLLPDDCEKELLDENVISDLEMSEEETITKNCHAENKVMNKSGQIITKQKLPLILDKDSFSEDDEMFEDPEVPEKTNNCKSASPKPLDSLKRLSGQISVKQSSPIPKKPAENIHKSNEDIHSNIPNLSDKAESTSHIEALKKLGSNITFKSNKTVSRAIPSSEEANESNANSNCESPSHINALKKLGSNITLKSNKPATSNNTGTIVKYKNGNNQPQTYKQGTFINSTATKSMTSYNKINTNTANRSIVSQSVSMKKFSQETSVNNTSSAKTVHKSTNQVFHEKNDILHIEDSDDEESLRKFNQSQNSVKNPNAAAKIMIRNRPGPACSKIGFQSNIEKQIKNELNKAKMEMQNSLKKLGHNITIKPNNSIDFPESPSHFDTSLDGFEDEDANSNDSKIGKVKITELGEDLENEESEDENIDQQENAIVESPEHSDDETDFQQIDNHIDDEINVKKHEPMLKRHPSQLKNLGKNITIKSLNKNINSENTFNRNTTQQRHIAGETTKPESSNSQQLVSRPANKQITQKSVNKNSVNTEVTTSVKTYQTETVIEEVTTTVTKTIRTVNKTVNQEQNNSKQTLATNKIQNRAIQGIRPMMQGKNAVRAPIRPSMPNTRPRMNCVGGNTVRPANQLVPVRPNFNTQRPAGPRMQVCKTATPNTNTNRSLRVAPNVNLNASVKRQATNDTSGPFSQFKKTRESLIPGDELEHGNNSVQQFASASRVMEKNTTSTKIMRGNSTVTQMKNESFSKSSQQHMSKLGNISNLKVTKSCQSQQSSYSEVKNENTSTKRNSTLDAIERLQKQGLLIKKPRIEDDNVESEHSDFDET